MKTYELKDEEFGVICRALRCHVLMGNDLVVKMREAFRCSEADASPITDMIAQDEKVLESLHRQRNQK